MLAPLPSTILHLTTALALLAVPASAATYAGGVDMRQACEWQYGSGWYDVNIAAPFRPPSAYTWYCIHNSIEGLMGINVNAYCARRYGGNAYADPQGEGVYDWGCFWP
jgi:hypothetical protein